MNEEILKPKVQSVGLIELVALGATKTITERALTPVIGNGTVMSGGIKMVGGGAIHKMVGGKAGTILGGALVVDGAEDLGKALVDWAFGGRTAGNAPDEWA